VAGRSVKRPREMVLEARMAVFATRRPAVAGCRASGMARFWEERRTGRGQ
jgi:hypothetical protein